MFTTWVKLAILVTMFAIVATTLSDMLLVDFLITSFQINKILDFDLDDRKWIRDIGGSILNNDRSRFVFPNDELEMALSFSNVLDYQIIVHTNYYLETEDTIKTPTRIFEQPVTLSSGDLDTIKTKFRPVDEGVHSVKLNFKIVNETNKVVLDTFDDSVNFRVQPLTVKLQAENNETNFHSFVAAMSVASVTALVLALNYYNSRKQVNELKNQNKHVEGQLSLMKTEMESRYRPVLETIEETGGIKSSEDSHRNFWRFKLQNLGSIPAENVRISFSEPMNNIRLRQLIQREQEIKSSSFPIEGSVVQRIRYPVNAPEFETDTVTEPDVAVWIVYDYLERHDVEMIFTFRINGGNIELKHVYLHEDIQRDRQNWTNTLNGNVSAEM